MSTSIPQEIKHIFYFNINYACNNHCVFCYSHNTIVSKKHDECSFQEIQRFLESAKLGPLDRIIINGGEPLLHSEIIEILRYLQAQKCEVLVYTNGRLINSLPVSAFGDNFRFIVPIYGNEHIHDLITRCPGSFKETISSINWSAENTTATIDIKNIINNEMIADNYTFDSCLNAFQSLNFNGAVHITSMADTKVSIANGCKSIENSVSAIYTKKLFDFWNEKGKTIKLFDTCVEKILKPTDGFSPYEIEIDAYFKDCHLSKPIPLTAEKKEECSHCHYQAICFSAVNQYKVLEWNGRTFFENLE